jgi:hypothetical protein
MATSRIRAVRPATQSVAERAARPCRRFRQLAVRNSRFGRERDGKIQQDLVLCRECGLNLEVIPFQLAADDGVDELRRDVDDDRLGGRSLLS